MILPLLIIPEAKKYWFGVQQGQFYLVEGGTSLPLVYHPFSDGATIKIPSGEDILLH